MASCIPAGNELRDEVTSAGKVHIPDNVSEEEFACDERQQIAPGNANCSSDDVIKDGPLHASTDVSDKIIIKETSSSQSAEELHGNYVVGSQTPLTEKKDVNIDVIDDAHDDKDQTEDIASKTAETRRDELPDDAEHGAKNVINKAEGWVIVEASDEDMDIAREANEEASDETKDIVRGTNEEAGDETKDIVIDEAKSEASKEAKDDTNGKVSRETYDGTSDEAKGSSRSLTIDGTRDESRDRVKHGVSKDSDGLDQSENGVAIPVEEDIWRHIMKTDEWTRRVKSLMEEFDVEIKESTAGDGMRPRIFGRDRSNIDRARSEVSNLLSECRKVVHTINVPCNDSQVHSKVVRLLKSINKLPCYVSAAPELLRITGTSEEIRSCMEKLETYGVRYEADQNDDDAAIPVEEDIWRYILKTDEWSRRVRCLIDELQVEINESTSGDGMALRIFGMDNSNIDRARSEVSNLVSDCVEVVRTVKVPCNDSQVHSKVARLLKSINKLPCYVSAAPELLRVTGKNEEIRSCLEKLETYGVHYEPGRTDEATGEDSKEAKDDTNGKGSRETYDGTSDEAKGSSRGLTSDGTRDESRDGVKHGVSKDSDGLDQSENGVAIPVEEDIWRYIMKTEEWTRRVKSLIEEHDVEIKESTSGDGMRPRIFGMDNSNIDGARSKVLNLLSECLDVVRTIKVPCNDSQVHSKIVRLLKLISRLPCYVSVAPELLRITGTSEEIQLCLEKLETYGVRYESNQNDDDAAIPVEEDIWRYIEKTEDWSRRIRSLTEELDVEIRERTSGGRMGLRIFGMDRSNIDRARSKVSNLLSDCLEVVRTIKVPCNDSQVHAKVVRLLKSINKLSCYVSAAPDLLRVTGTSEEIQLCLEKLETYGVRYESGKTDVEMSSEQKKIAPKSVADSHQQNLLSRQLPVPIEKHLWHFIQKKRKSDLRELEDGFGVAISTQPTHDVTTITVCVSMQSSDNPQLLGLAVSALSQLIERLCLQVIVHCVSEGESLATVSPETLKGLHQELAHVDVIFEVIANRNSQNPGHRLLMIGPEKELVLNQQVIQRALVTHLCPNGRTPNSDDDETSNGMSNANQQFPGSGHRLGSRSPGEERQPSRDNASHGHVRSATGEPSFQKRPPEPEGTTDKSAGHHSTGERPSETQSSSGTPSRVLDPSLTRPQASATSSDPSGVRQKSSEQSAGGSVTEHTKAKEKKVTFADPMDGIRVYPTEEPRPSNSQYVGKPDISDQNGRCSPSKTVTRSRNERDAADTSGGRPAQCSTCKDVPKGPQRASGCNHVLCMACVMDYMTHANVSCPVCSKSGHPKAAPTQPIGGQMLVTRNNASRLPGFEDSSQGMIIITYLFKQGYQTDDCLSPGQLYPGLTKTAFLPLSPVGNEVLDLLQKAFEARLTFRIDFTTSHPSGELVWNEIFHKENIFGGPKEGGYPDPVYMEHVRQDLLAKGIH